MIKFIIPIFIIVLVLYLYSQIRFIKIRKMEFHSKKIMKEKKILHLTDIHANPFLDYKKIENSILEEKPDLICITGDIIKSDNEEFKILDPFFSFLRDSRIPVYYIFGNHDIRNRNRMNIYRHLEPYHFQILKDDKVIAASDLIVIGYDHRNRLAALCEESEKFILSLIHDPILFVRSHEKSNLVLSGHTHGGQVRFPILGALYAPNQKIPPKYNKGLYSTKRGSIYIDSGLGYSLLPLRFLNPVQMSYILLKK